MRAEQITGSVAYHGEGAFWDDREQRFRFVDMLAGDVLTLLPTGTLTRRHVGDVAAVIRARRDGGYVVAVEHSVLLLDEQWTIEKSVRLLDDPGIRLNEGGCDPAGTFFIGSMAYDAADGAGTLFRIGSDRGVGVAIEHVTIPNGLVWSVDGGRAFHNDTVPGTVTVYDVAPDDGALRDPRPFLHFGGEGGVPDGMAGDVDGGLWIAMWGGGSVRHYSADGELDEIVEVPGATNVTSCAFGGPDLRTLYITTSREGVEGDREPAAGAIFATGTPVAGAPLVRFAG